MDYNLYDTFGDDFKGFGGPSSSFDVYGALGNPDIFTPPKQGLGSRIGNMFKGGGGQMFGALAGGLFSFLGARSAAAAQAKAAEAQLKADADRMKFGMMRGREQDMGSMGYGIGQTVTRYGTGADLDFDRQKKATVFSKTRGRELDRLQNMRDARAKLNFRLSPQFARMRQGQFNRRVKEMKARAMFSPEAMKYGPIAFRTTV